MSDVQPIRKQNQIKAVCSYLKSKDEKYYIMFIIGIQSGLRISDILQLRVTDIDKMHDTKISEKKTGKKRFLYINDATYSEITAYISKHHLNSDDYLIPSKKHSSDGSIHPISRIQAYRVLKEAGEACGFSAMGTHTMRKTFGYHYYKKTHNIVPLMRIFNHSSQDITLKYIGIESAEIEDSLRDFVLF